MANDKFVTVKSSTGAEAFLKVTAEDGATVLIPNSAAVSLDADAVQAIVDSRKSFEYADLLKKIRYSKKPNGKVSNLSEGEDTLQVVDLILNQGTDNPLIAVRNIDIETAAVDKVELNAQLSYTLLNMITAAGFTSDYPTIADIQYVETLPNETAADNKTVYLWKKEYYKLNAAEDAYTKLTGKFEEVPDLYPFTTKAKENVLYNLTGKYVSPWNEIFERGVYTYTASTNKAILTELSIKQTKKLPDITTAEATVIYELTKDDGAIEGGAKGTRWKVGGTTEAPAWVKETREVITDTTVPFGPLAVKDTYYIVGETMKQAGTSSYTTIGRVVSVRSDAELPSVEKITLEKDVVYVLTKDSGEKKAGSKWMFDFTTTKSFVSYESLLPETTEAGGEGITP